MEGVAYRVSPVSLIFRALGFIGVLLVVLDCGCGWEVSRRVLCGVALVVFDRGFHQTAEKRFHFMLFGDVSSRRTCFRMFSTKPR